MGMIQSNSVYKETISVFGYDGESPLTGLASSAFSFSFLLNSSSYTDSMTTAVSEIGSTGRYEVSVTFPSVGFWSVFVDITHNSGVIETHQLNVHVEDVSGDSIYSSSLAGSIAMTQNVGGLSSGTTVSSLSDGTKTVSQVLDQLLFPTAHPTKTNPSCTISRPGSLDNLQVVGSTINFTLNTTANRGTINTSWAGTQGPYAGEVTSATVRHDGVDTNIGIGPGATDVDDVTVSNYVVQLNNNEWKLTVTFADGPDPLDSTGAVSTELSSYSSGNKTNTASFKGVYPIKVGTSAGGFADRALVLHSSNTVTISQAYDETSSVRHRVKISDAMIGSDTVVFQQWNPVSSSYADLGSGEFTSESVTETVEGLLVGYTMFTKAGSLGGGDVSGQAIYRVRFD